MAQHDYVIANQSGSAFRADLNNALSATVTGNSGSSAPSTTYAYMIWNDTTSNQRKIRNSANNAWIVLSTLSGGNVFDDDVTFTGASANVTWDKSADDFIFNDNAKAVFGTSSDGIAIYHDGSNSYIHDGGTGQLRVSSSNFKVLNAAQNETIINAVENGAVSLYYDNVSYLQTINGGVNTTSGHKITGLAGGNAALLMYADDAGQNADKWMLASEHVGNGFTISSYAAGAWQTVLKATDSRTIELHYQGSAKLATLSEGCKVTGNLLVNTDSNEAGIGDSSGATQFCFKGASEGARFTCTGISYWNQLASAQYNIRFRRQGSNAGNIYSESNGTTSFNTSSDYRLKQNVKAYTNGITKLKKLKPCEFEFKLEPGKVVDGFIAHEVTDAGFPWIVKGTKDAVESDGKIDAQSMDYGKLSPILTAALQEAIAKIETLETKVAALEAK